MYICVLKFTEKGVGARALGCRSDWSVDLPTHITKKHYINTLACIYFVFYALMLSHKSGITT